MRLRRALPLALLPLMALPAAAAATPTVGGTATADPLGLQVSIDPPPGATPLAASGGQLPGLDTLTVALGSGFALAPASFATCDRAAMTMMGVAACSPGSQIGSGEAAFDAYVGGSTLSGTTDDLRLFRGAEDGQLLMYIHASEPADTTYDLELRTSSTPAGPQLVLDASPATVAQGFPVAIRRLRLSFDLVGDPSAAPAAAPAAPPKLANCRPLHGARRARCERHNRDLEFCLPGAKACRPRARHHRRTRRHPAHARQAAVGSRYVTSTACAAGGTRPVHFTLAFTDGSTGQADATVPCA